MILLGSLLLSVVGVLLMVFSLLRNGPGPVTWVGLGLCVCALVLKRFSLRRLRNSSNPD